ncbi:MAG TPA: chloride channel protein [Balneolales bacterium]|nr:chloride channel protein [Balneolales bacterium]
MIEKGKNRLIFDSVIIGIVGALGAQLIILSLHYSKIIFLQWIAGYKEPGLPSEGGVIHQVVGPHGLWLIPVVTTIGGLISGWLVYYFAPEAEGHATDTAIRSFHEFGGAIRARMPFLKTLTAVITIGSGGSAGREGPSAFFAAGIASIYSNIMDRSVEERRMLVLVGISAGLSAIFRSPIGSAIFGIEILYSSMEFETEALIYTMLAAIVAYTLNGVFVGWESLFQVPTNLQVTSIEDYASYIVLGLGCGLVSTMFPTLFYTIRDLFKKIHIPNHIKPALGGLGVGVIAMWFPQILSGGYGWIQQAIYGQLSVPLLIALIFLNMLALSLTISSGGSGGLFVPTLYVGAMVGALFAHLFHQSSAAFVVVGMAALFAGSARVPIAAILMVTEMTGGYQMLVPASLAVMVSYLIQSKLTSNLKYKSLYEAQVPHRSDSPANHEEHLRIALDLLGNKDINIPTYIGHLDLLTLIKSGIPIDLPGNKKFFITKIDKQSSLIGHSVNSNPLSDAHDELEIVSVMRDGEVMFPKPDIKLKEEDQLLLISSEEHWQEIKDQLILPDEFEELNKA